MYDPGDTNQFEETITGSSSNGDTLRAWYHGYGDFVDNTTHDFNDGNGTVSASEHDFDYIQSATLTLR